MKISVNTIVFEAVIKKYVEYLDKPIGRCLSVPIYPDDAFEIERVWSYTFKRNLTPEKFELLDDEWEGKRDQIVAMLMGWA